MAGSPDELCASPQTVEGYVPRSYFWRKNGKRIDT